MVEARADDLRKRLAFAITFMMRASNVFVSNSPNAYPAVVGRWFSAIDWAMRKRERAYCIPVERGEGQCVVGIVYGDGKTSDVGTVDVVAVPLLPSHALVP